MIAPTAGDVALACMGVFAGELHRQGVSHVCISPGSRSTPLVLAIARHGGFRVSVHLDERSAGFFALGAARGADRPAALVCTSGTAVANWLPAVVEASMAQVPLLLLSADRPPALRGTGANQTIDQVEIFGGFVRWFVDAPVPEAGPEASRRWRSLAAAAVRVALGPVPGPVHLNLPFGEPLVPSGIAVDLEALASPPPDERAPWVSHLDEPPASVSSLSTLPLVASSVAEELASLIAATERGLLVAGGGAGGPAVARLAAHAGWPLLAEPSSGARTGPPALSCGPLLLGSPGFADAHPPDLVVQLGSTPTSRAVLRAVAAAKRLVVVTAPGVEADPARAAWLRLHGDPAVLAATLADRITPRQPSGWPSLWRAADQRVARAVSSWLSGLGEELFEGAVAREVAASLPDGSVLFAGSSMPVRDLDAFMLPRSGVWVLGNRGASGIDGSVSTALGLSTSSGAEPPGGGGTWPASPVLTAPPRVTRTFALIGDLALLHDAGALLWGAHGRHDLVIVVINNDGGGVFSLLDQATLPEHEPLFATPHGLDIAALARAAAAGHRLVSRQGELATALSAAAAAGGVQLVEVRTDRRRQALLRGELAAAVAASVSDLSSHTV